MSVGSNDIDAISHQTHTKREREKEREEVDYVLVVQLIAF